MKLAKLLLFGLAIYCCNAQNLPPKQACSFSVKQIHSGHSLTDPLFYPHWPGQYVNLMGTVLQQSPWQLVNKVVGKSTSPGSQIIARWEKPPGNGAPDARHDIANWELLAITERVPLYYDGGSTQQWYIKAIADQRNALSQFVNHAWTNGNQGEGAPTLLWTTWVHVDGSSGDFRTMLDVQGIEWERMQDYANERRAAGSPPVYLIPGHKMMARIYDDIQKGIVPGVTSISQMFSDQIHTNELGAYAISMIHYACLFNRSPVGLPHNLIPNAPSGTIVPTPALAAYIQHMVWDVVTGYSRTGITNTTNVDEHVPADCITIGPNPADDMIMVQWHRPLENDHAIRVYDAQGTQVTFVQVGRGQTTTTVDLSECNPGVYVLTTGSSVHPTVHVVVVR